MYSAIDSRAVGVWRYGAASPWFAQRFDALISVCHPWRLVTVRFCCRLLQSMQLFTVSPVRHLAPLIALDLRLVRYGPHLHTHTATLDFFAPSSLM